MPASTGQTVAAFLRWSSDPATFEEVRRYQLHLGSSAVGVPIINQSISTLRFFFKITLRRHDIVEHTHFIQEPRRLAGDAERGGVARLLDAARGPNTSPPLARLKRSFTGNSRILAATAGRSSVSAASTAFTSCLTAPQVPA
jgi:hypothetical protein